MPFDEALAVRVRKALGKRAGIVEKKMFGGVESDATLRKWVQAGVDFAASLPPNAAARSRSVKKVHRLRRSCS